VPVVLPVPALPLLLAAPPASVAPPLPGERAGLLVVQAPTSANSRDRLRTQGMYVLRIGWLAKERRSVGVVDRENSTGRSSGSSTLARPRIENRSVICFFDIGRVPMHLKRA